MQRRCVDCASKFWLGDAPALTVDDCVESIQTEVLVVGAALAGSMAAYGAVRAGAKTTVIERNGSGHVGGMEISFLNSNYQLEQGVPEFNKVEFCNNIFNNCQFRADMGMWAIWANRSGEVFDNLKEDVLDPYNLYYEVDFAADLWPDPSIELTQYNSSGIVFSDTDDKLTNFMAGIHEYLEDNGVEIHYSTRAEVLVKDDDGAVVGLIATNADGESVYYEASKGVIMCTGSFGANEDMMREFYTSDFVTFAMNHNCFSVYMDADVVEIMDDGLGHKMLCWAGAQMEPIGSYQAWTNKGYAGFPYLQVNSRGRRFGTECNSLLTSAHVMTMQPDVDNYVWQIIPTNDFEMPTTFGWSLEFLESNTDFLDGIEIYEEDTIEALAEDIGVDPDTLVGTVERYNELCYAGEDLDYMKASRYLDAIDDPPYRAVKLCYNFFCTTAGVKCDNNLQVLDENLDPIPGLYAAGNTVGYRFGSVYQNCMHGGTNAIACTHGYVAGENAANA